MSLFLQIPIKGQSLGQLVGVQSKAEMFAAIDKAATEAKADRAQLAQATVPATNTLAEPEGKLGADSKGDTLGDNFMGDTLDASFVGDTLDASFVGDTLGKKVMTTGLSKSDFVSALLDDSKRPAMSFPVLFLESCHSELAKSLVEQAKTEKHGTRIGSLYTSDKTGLRFNTIDYGDLFDRVAANEGRLAQGVVSYLDQQQAEQIPITAPSTSTGN